MTRSIVSRFAGNPSLKALLRSLYCAARTLRSHLAKFLAKRLIGDAPYQTVRFDGLTIRDFRDGGLLYLRFMGELDWYRELRTIAGLTASNPGIIDVGGNVGASTLPMSQVPGSKVLVFEPFTEVAALLRENLDSNGATNVDLRLMGLGDRDETLVYQDGGVAQECLFSTVDAVASGLASVDFIKIDTDGYDLRVLQGAMGTMRRHQPVVVTEFISRDLRLRSGDEAQRTYAALLEQLGYDAFIQPPFGRWRFVPNAQVATGTFSTNLLLLPRDGRGAVRAACC